MRALTAVSSLPLHPLQLPPAHPTTYQTDRAVGRAGGACQHSTRSFIAAASCPHAPSLLTQTLTYIHSQAALSGAQAALASKVREVSSLLAATPAAADAASIEQLKALTGLLSEMIAALGQAQRAAAGGGC